MQTQHDTRAAAVHYLHSQGFHAIEVKTNQGWAVEVSLWNEQLTKQLDVCLDDETTRDLAAQLPRSEWLAFAEAPRWCSATGEPMRNGYCWDDGDMYFCSSEQLALYLRSKGWDPFDSLEDMDLIHMACEDGRAYWTDWYSLPRSEWDPNPNRLPYAS